jgi:hypothetical protein
MRKKYQKYQAYINTMFFDMYFFFFIQQINLSQDKSTYKTKMTGVNVYTYQDADLSLVQNKKVAFIGYGNQGMYF